MTLLRAGVAWVDGAGRPTREFFEHVRRLSGDATLTDESIAAVTEAVAAIASALGSPDGTIENIPPLATPEFIVTGNGSISVFGTPAEGKVQVSLSGDEVVPGNGQFYGAGVDGEKGFHALADFLAATANLTLTIGADGVTTADIADLADSGTGAALVKLTRDAKGRVAGTQTVQATDLASRITLTSASALSALRAIVVENGVARYPDTSVTSDAARVVGVSVTAGTTFDAVTAGEVADASWSWTPGIVWCGADGVLTQTPPAGWVLEIGRALDATRLFVAIKTPFLRA